MTGLVLMYHFGAQYSIDLHSSHFGNSRVITGVSSDTNEGAVPFRSKVSQGAALAHVGSLTKLCHTK